MCSDGADKYPSDELNFELLGSFQIWRNGQPVDAGHRLQQAVLVLLALRRGHVMQRDFLIDELWGEEPPASAVNIVQTYVGRLRKILEPERQARDPGRILITSGGGYALAVEPANVDVFRFEDDLDRAMRADRRGDTVESVAALRTALNRWHGGALSGLPGPGVNAERERLRELRWLAFERWVRGELTLGRSETLIGELKAAIAHRPLHERLWGFLMLALEQSGRCSDALEAYRQSRALLAAELGVEPGPELQEIHQKILAIR